MATVRADQLKHGMLREVLFACFSQPALDAYAAELQPPAAR